MADRDRRTLIDLPRDVRRFGLTTYWLSLEGWDQLNAWKREGGFRGMAALIDARYQVWCTGHMVVKDPGVVSLWNERLAQGWGSPLDPVMYEAVFMQWGGREKRGMNLSVRAVEELALWAHAEGVWRRQADNVIGVAGLCASALEIIARGWWEA